MSNSLRLLDIDEAAAMLHCSVAKVRQMVIEDRTLAAIHVDRMGFRKPFEFRGLQVFVVDDLGVIFDRGRGREPAGFLRFTFPEVIRVLSEWAHSEANAVPLSELFPALGESEPSALACGGQTPVVAVGASGDVEPWKEKARVRAFEIIKRDKKKDLYPSQENIADEIAAQFRKDWVTGADGKPLSGATIKRHALKGISSDIGKKLSMTMARGKRGNQT